MNIRCIASVVYFSAAGVLCAVPLDDKIKAFEEAVQKTPAVKLDAAPGIWPRGRDITVDDLNAVIQRGTNDGEISAIVSRLTAAHPSDAVKQTGAALIEELQAQHANRAKAFATKAEAVLAEAPDAITHAKTAADLDGILTSLKALQNPQGGFSQDGGQDVSNRIASTYQFATQWQNYLAAAAGDNWLEAQNSLRSILQNPRIDAPDFFPRSEILARFEATFHGGVATQATAASPDAASSDPDPILRKIQKPEDLEPLLSQLEATPPIPGYNPWDWSEFRTLARARDDILAGLPVTIDLKKAMNWEDWGDQWSRIIAMELLFLLPHYLGTEVSSPPKETETLAAYLDRLVTEANAAGDLALVQRALAVKVALTAPVDDPSPTPTGTARFLAGLSQDAAGQYDLAVDSYENALQDPDVRLPIKVVSERLAAIKKKHPEEFEKGLATFQTPAPPNVDPFGRPAGWPYRPNPYGGQQNVITVLPIPNTISIPAKAAPPATNSTTPTPSADTK